MIFAVPKLKNSNSFNIMFQTTTVSMTIYIQFPILHKQLTINYVFLWNTCSLHSDNFCIIAITKIWFTNH